MEGIIAAFFIGGAFCAAFQVIQDYTGSIPPRILLVGIGAGALAAALGIMGALGAFAGAGTGILVIGFGEAVYMAVQGLLQGDWTGHPQRTSSSWWCSAAWAWWPAPGIWPGRRARKASPQQAPEGEAATE